jgi:hypothetical protein
MMVWRRLTRGYHTPSCRQTTRLADSALSEMTDVECLEDVDIVSGSLSCYKTLGHWDKLRLSRTINNAEFYTKQQKLRATHHASKTCLPILTLPSVRRLKEYMSEGVVHGDQKPGPRHE